MRIFMPTSNNYTRYCELSCRLLNKYWPDHPPVDVVHFDESPDIRHLANFRLMGFGKQSGMSWVEMVVKYLSEAPDIVIIFLDDYGLIREPDRDALAKAAWRICCCNISQISLTWQPARKVCKSGQFDVIDRWDYSINTQVGFWKTADILRCFKAIDQNLGPWQMETAVSHYWNHSLWHEGKRMESWHIPEPDAPSGFVDSVDKTHWPVAYNNMTRQGRFDERHRDWFAKEFG